MPRLSFMPSLELTPNTCSDPQIWQYARQHLAFQLVDELTPPLIQLQYFCDKLMSHADTDEESQVIIQALKAIESLKADLNHYSVAPTPNELKEMQQAKYGNT